MEIEIRHAIPDDADSIYHLMSRHQIRLREFKSMGRHATSTVSPNRIRHRIEHSRARMQLFVALGAQSQVLAMLQMGVWSVDRENEFTPSRWGRFLNGLRAEWPECRGLYGLAVNEEYSYDHPVVSELLAESRVFTVDSGETLYAPLAITSDGTVIDPDYQTLLIENGMDTTDRIGSTTIPGLVRTGYYARLMAKQNTPY